MSKKKNNSKNVKKDVIKKIESAETGVEKDLLKILRIVFVVMFVFAFFYLLTIVVVGRDEKEEIEEVSIQYEEILAGSSFTMRDKEYLVVYYDFNSEDATEINSAIYSYSTSYDEDKLRVYTVDMSNQFNKKYASTDSSNEKPETASDLLINVPTIIRIVNGEATEYIDDFDDVLEYLK